MNGAHVGSGVGVLDGTVVGNGDGCCVVGMDEGPVDGASDGLYDGTAVGAEVGPYVGSVEGKGVGIVGSKVGALLTVGSRVGDDELEAYNARLAALADQDARGDPARGAKVTTPPAIPRE